MSLSNCTTPSPTPNYLTSISRWVGGGCLTQSSMINYRLQSKDNHRPLTNSQRVSILKNYSILKYVKIHLIFYNCKTLSPLLLISLLAIFALFSLTYQEVDRMLACVTGARVRFQADADISCLKWRSRVLCPVLSARNRSI